MTDAELPGGLQHVRTTAVLSDRSHPGGLLRAHRVADGVWARLRILTGRLLFVWEAVPDERIVLGEGDTIVIPPAELHHVEFTGGVTFEIEFHKVPDVTAPTAGAESGGLAP